MVEIPAVHVPRIIPIRVVPGIEAAVEPGRVPGTVATSVGIAVPVRLAGLITVPTAHLLGELVVLRQRVDHRGVNHLRLEATVILIDVAVATGIVGVLRHAIGHLLLLDSLLRRNEVHIVIVLRHH